MVVVARLKLDYGMLRLLQLAKSREAYRDKIGRGLNKLSKGGPRQNKVGMSFRDNVVEIRKVLGAISL